MMLWLRTTMLYSICKDHQVVGLHAYAYTSALVLCMCNCGGNGKACQLPWAKHADNYLGPSRLTAPQLPQQLHRHNNCAEVYAQHANQAFEEDFVGAQRIQCFDVHHQGPSPLVGPSQPPVVSVPECKLDCDSAVTVMTCTQLHHLPIGCLTNVMCWACTQTRSRQLLACLLLEEFLLSPMIPSGGDASGVAHNLT